MYIRILLVCAQGAARDAYLKELAGLDVPVDVVVAASPCEVHEQLRGEPFQGILFDLPTLIREKHFDKRELLRLEELLPVMRARFDAASGMIAGLSGGDTLESGPALQAFVKGECAGFSPRSMRRSDRAPLHLPVLLCTGQQWSADACENAFTLNISMLGCSVCTMVPRKIGSELWMVFADFRDKTPVPARVNWCTPWGERGAVPSLGLVFTALTESQIAELDSLRLAGPIPALAPDEHAV